MVFQATGTEGNAAVRVDLDGVVAGQSISIASLELVQVTPSAAAQASAAIVNAAATPLSAACPFTGANASSCAQSFDLATGQALSWPLSEIMCARLLSSPNALPPIDR